jgi:hypothetical protein
VNDADDLRFVVLSGVDERLLLVDARSVWSEQLVFISM